jgi:hypothetical protein
MRTTLNLSDDAMLTAQSYARRLQISLGEAVSRLIRNATAPQNGSIETPLRGKFALAPQRDEVITTQHVRELMEREGI